MIEVLVLAILQGIAEFLPISSSGHLVTVGAWFGELPDEPTLEILLHAGTLGSILVVYRTRILELLRRDRRVTALLVVGTIPAAVIGVLIKTQFSELLRSPVLAGWMLIVTGLMLIGLGRLSQRRQRTTTADDPNLEPRDASPSGVADAASPDAARSATPADAEAGMTYSAMSYAAALAVGCFQAFAILPGISRSGSTILGGRLMGLKDEDSVTFSFLLAIPAIGGATLFAIKDLVESEGASGRYSLASLVAGALIAFVVGLLALRWLIDWSRRGRLHWFAWWCIPFGALVVVYFGVLSA